MLFLRALPRHAWLPVLVLLSACASGAAPRLEPVAPATVAVNETLRIPLVVHDGTGSLSFRVEGPDLPGFDRTAGITGGAGGGEFHWTPLSNHVGTHEVAFLLMDGSSEIDRQATVITVTPSADSAPVFLRPGAGGTYDLTRDPCVRFDVEVRDDDSTTVAIRARDPLPDGASLTSTGDKRAAFEWCPSPDQVASSERFAVALEADDGDHPPTPHDYVVVLRAGAKPGCPGEPPVITVIAPTEGERVNAAAGYQVAVSVTDDLGLRDVPLLFWTTTAPDDPSAPDITSFEQVEFTPSGSNFVARVPSLGLAPGATQDVYLIVSATDNDDAAGATCDHHTDSPLRTFTAVGSSTSGALSTCAPCTQSTDCASGICTAESGGVCLAACDASGGCSAGRCVDTTTREGGVVRACGGASVACGGGASCVDDAREDNDSLATATPYVAPITDGQICSGDDDYFRIHVPAGMQVSVMVDGFVHAAGDLDLALLGASGSILATSAGTTNVETASQCLAAGGDVYARVTGFGGDENSYHLRADLAAGACCLDDAGEDDDTRTTARAPAPDGNFDGTVCPSDDDYIRVNVTGPSTIAATIVFTPSVGDLDLELLDATGAVIASSNGATDTESITKDVNDVGTYVLRVFGFRDSRGDYLGDVHVTARTSCTTSNECPSDQVCGSSGCVARSCTTASTCPSGYGCPTAGPSPATSECGVSCTVNSNCRSTESCKRFPEGRYCARNGAGLNGDACASFTACGGQRACMPWAGGYCARAGCTSNADCEAGTFCVVQGGTPVCLRDCWDSDAICRLAEGYVCDLVTDRAAELQFACVPPA